MGSNENDMKLVNVLLLVLLSGGVMAAPDNLNGKKFEQLEQMIKDLEGQMTALTIENALLNDAVSDLERDLGDAEFEIIQLENTVAILSAGGETKPETGFVGLTNSKFKGDAGFSTMTNACIEEFGEFARMAFSEERLKANVLVAGYGWANPTGVSTALRENFQTDSTGVEGDTLNCSNWTRSDTRTRGVTIGNGILSQICSATRPVACSAPI